MPSFQTLSWKSAPKATHSIFAARVCSPGTRANSSRTRGCIVQTIATTLQEILPCYTFGTEAAWHEECNPHFAVIEAVQVEGHTDTEGVEIGNLMLSTARANVAFTAMLERERLLTDHLNVRDQPVLSVAGYGWMRPLAGNDTPEGRARNRRIDLRIIMHTPTGVDDVDLIVSRLRGSLAESA